MHWKSIWLVINDKIIHAISRLFLTLGPHVEVENEHGVINLGNVKVGKVSTGLVHLKNNSDVCALFQVSQIILSIL